MLLFESAPLFFVMLPLLLVTCSGSANERPHFHHLRPVRASEQVDNDGENFEVVQWTTRRSLAETVRNSTLILAEKRTRRKDPLDGFNHYNGGWNITDKHYWSSVGSTGAPLLIIAGFWFILFGLSLLLICCCCCCRRRERYGYSRIAFVFSLNLLVLFTTAAIVGCIVLYIGQGKFHNSTTNTLDYVVNQANTVTEKLGDLSEYLSAAKRVGVDQDFLLSDSQNGIDKLQLMINSIASNFGSKTKKKSKDIQHVSNIVRLVFIIIAAFMLLLAFFGFVFSILGLRGLVYFLVIIGWILVAGMFILSGILALLHKLIAYRAESLKLNLCSGLSSFEMTTSDALVFEFVWNSKQF